MKCLTPVAALALLAGCSQPPAPPQAPPVEVKKDVYYAFIYPPKGWAMVGTFGTLDECRVASINNLRRLGHKGAVDYECEIGCKWDAKNDIYLCEGDAS